MLDLGNKDGAIFIYVKTFLIFIMFGLFGANVVHGQNLIANEAYGFKPVSKPEKTHKTELSIPVKLPLSYWFVDPVSMPADIAQPQQSIIKKTDPAHAYKNLGVICQWEYRLEQSLKFPVKFRLGEYHYVQKLEGKSLHNLDSKHKCNGI